MTCINECIEGGPGHINKDGYRRHYVDKPGGGRRLIFAHRRVWEEVHGPIPEGKELDHMCKNRACHNINHLRLIDKSEHKIITNLFRYRERIDAGKMRLLKGDPPKDIAADLGAATATVRQWRRGLKSALANPLDNPLLSVAHLLEA